MLQFQLAVEPLSNASYALTVLQRPYPASRNGQTLPSINVGRVDGLALVSAQDIIFDVLRSNHHKPTALQHARPSHLGLSEESGVRLSVLFKVIAPLSNLDVLRALQQGIWAMSDEEVYYWFSKCSGPNGDRGVRALRLLHGGDFPPEQKS
jgi:hypothetical protein